MKTISILGCGWFGLAFAKKLVELGYDVKGSSTSPEKLSLLADEKMKPYLVNFTSERIIADAEFFETDALFICIPPKRNSTELNSYPQKIKAILAASEHKANQVILISSTSVYGDENRIVNEDSPTHPDTDSGKMVLAAEDILKKSLPQHFTIIRFAGLIGPNRNPGRFFAGKTDVPNGLAPVNLIHQTDAVGIATAILEKQAFGRVYNACSPDHPTKKVFYTAAANKTGLIEPKFIAEKTNWKVVESLNVPEFLDYNFQVVL